MYLLSWKNMYERSTGTTVYQIYLSQLHFAADMCFWPYEVNV